MPEYDRFYIAPPLIVRALPRRVRLLIDQAEHARLAGEMAAAWTGDAPQGTALVEAAHRHDDGWREWDRRPRLNPETGEPHTYRDVPPDDHLGVWERTVEAGWAHGDEVGLQVSLHGCRFFARKARPADRAFLRRERERQGAVLGMDPDRIPHDLPRRPAADHARMGFWDGLSLFLCDGWESPWETEVPRSDDEPRRVAVRRTGGEPDPDAAETVVLAPYPFRDALDLIVGARRITGAPFDSQGAMDQAIAAAGRVTLRWRLSAP